MRKRRPGKQAAPSFAKTGKPRVVIALVVAGVAAVISIYAWARWQSGRPLAEEQYVSRPHGQITFNKDIAPIVFQHCSGCHRPGQSAPFSLLSYRDVKKRAASIAEATARRYMPPWLPEHGYGEFSDERRLSADQLGIIQQWVAEGAIEGTASDLPALPQWSGEWQLGKPDLVVTVPQPYHLAPEGKDVYRNFVIQAPIDRTHYVKGIEFRSGNPKVVHHAFVKMDRTAESRRLDAEDAAPGFAGMSTPAEMPDGHFLGWQPGRVPSFVPDGLAWRLETGSDLVLQTHLNSSGKPETIQPSIGLYFTDQPPTNTGFKLVLTSLAVDIPAGATNYVVEDNYVLPVDAQVLAVLPHAHYLAREMQGWATRPDGTREWLLFIKEWDLNWQGDYRYTRPIDLPRGSKLSMRFTYDNSTNNLRNPNRPPKPVTYGPQTSDEMAELWLQLLPRNKTDRELLARDVHAKKTRLFIEADQLALRKNPNDAKARDDLAVMLMIQGRVQEAEQHFRLAIQSQPDFALAHYDYGVLLRQQNRLQEAEAEFETVLRLDPKDFKAHGNLGFIRLERGDLAHARLHFVEALRLNPADNLSKEGLEKTTQAERGGGRTRRPDERRR